MDTPLAGINLKDTTEFMKIQPHDTVYPRPSVYNETGMSIRSHFASMAMQGLLASPKDGFTHDAEASAPIETWQDLAKGAVQMADALIAELNKSAPE